MKESEYHNRGGSLKPAAHRNMSAANPTTATPPLVSVPLSPKDYREANNLDMLCDSAKIAYEEAVKKGLGDLKSTFSKSVDVSDAVQWAKSMVSGLDNQGWVEVTWQHNE